MKDRSTVRLYLLRHGEVTSHRGDIPITSDAKRQSYEVGRSMSSRETGPITVLSGETRRARSTAEHLARGIVEAGGEAVGPDVAFALRNPDLYLGGTRVNMVSSADALAEQVKGLGAHDVAALSFFPQFIESRDRIGWWLAHDTPPGETASTVAARLRTFAVSLTDPVPGRPQVVVGVTHSPLIRAIGYDFLGRDIGEPPWVSGLVMTVEPDGTMTIDLLAEEP